MPHLYPLMLDVTDRLVVIIGGGGVASRKVTGLLDAGATRIRVVSPAFVDTIPANIDRRCKRYEPADLHDADLVFAATDDPAVNDAVVHDAGSMGIWVNRADGSDESPGDFVTPAKLVKGSVMITVSAGSPALATRIRDGLDQRFDPAWEQMAAAMVQLRPMILKQVGDPAARRELFIKLVSDEAMKILITDGFDALAKWIGHLSVTRVSGP